MAPYAAIYLLGVLIASFSQVLLKKAAMKPHESIVREYLDPRVIFAYTLFVLTTFMTIYAYKEVPLSLGPILEATSYVYVAVFGVCIFGERLGARKIAALGLILAGIALYALGLR